MLLNYYGNIMVISFVDILLSWKEKKAYTTCLLSIFYCQMNLVYYWDKIWWVKQKNHTISRIKLHTNFTCLGAFTETFNMSHIRPLKVVKCVLQQDIIIYNYYNLLYNLQVIFLSLFPHLPYNWQVKMRKIALHTYLLVHFGNTTIFFLNLDTVPKNSRKIQRNLPKHDKLNEIEYLLMKFKSRIF